MYETVHHGLSKKEDRDGKEHTKHTDINKKVAEEYQVYDADLIMHINSVFSILTQLGVGPADGFSIEDDDALWTDFIPEKSKIEFIKSYMHLKVKLLFDPPLASAVIECMNQQIKELEWRILVAADPSGEEEYQNG